MVQNNFGSGRVQCRPVEIAVDLRRISIAIAWKPPCIRRVRQRLAHAQTFSPSSVLARRPNQNILSMFYQIPAGGGKGGANRFEASRAPPRNRQCERAARAARRKVLDSPIGSPAQIRSMPRPFDLLPGEFDVGAHVLSAPHPDSSGCSANTRRFRGSPPGIATSGDAARMSACATSARQLLHGFPETRGRDSDNAIPPGRVFTGFGGPPPGP
jgi:hypothetical protein